jgi:hypothetical protein
VEPVGPFEMHTDPPPTGDVADDDDVHR